MLGAGSVPSRASIGWVGGGAADGEGGGVSE